MTSKSLTPVLTSSLASRSLCQPTIPRTCPPSASDPQVLNLIHVTSHPPPSHLHLQSSYWMGSQLPSHPSQKSAPSLHCPPQVPQSHHPLVLSIPPSLWVPRPFTQKGHIGALATPSPSGHPSSSPDELPKHRSRSSPGAYQVKDQASLLWGGFASWPGMFTNHRCRGKKMRSGPLIKILDASPIK